MLMREDGRVCESVEEIHAEVQTFYTELYTAQPELDVEAVLHHVPAKVDQQRNDRLLRPFRAEEVKAALFSMKPSKAPGVDGFTAGFFQRHWKLLHHEVTEAVLDFLNGGELPLGFKDTSITLIPKVRHPQSISQYRPIALCRVLYKLAVKAIANRLRVCMDDIICEE